MKYKKSLECSLELLINGVAGDKIPKGMQKDALTIQKNTQKWLLSNGLQAMGIAKRTVAGQEQEETVLKAYIEKKLPKSQIREGLIPKYLEIPSSNSRLPIDVETIGKLRIQNNLNDHHRPLFPGLSIIRDGFLKTAALKTDANVLLSYGIFNTFSAIELSSSTVNAWVASLIL